MSVQTTRDITFACGHTESHDLGNKRSDQREGYAAFLAEGECFACLRKKLAVTKPRREPAKSD